MIDIVCLVVSLAIVSFAACVRPDRARCPTGWYLAMGVRPSGVFACSRTPVGQDVRDERGIVRDHSVEPPGQLWGQIYCTGGTRPISNYDGVTVGCQMDAWSP